MPDSNWSTVSSCEFLRCTLTGPASVFDHAGRQWWLCRRHAEIVARAVAGNFVVDTLEQTAKGDRVQVRGPGNYSGPDWDAHYRLLERPGHAIRANGAAFAVDPKAVPANVLICSCGWRGHYRMWPQHLRVASVPLALS